MAQAIKKGQSRETGNIKYTIRRKHHNTISVGHHYVQTNKDNVYKTGGKDEPNIDNKYFRVE